MKNRCYNPNCKGFKNYGGKEVRLSKSWQKFENFYSDMKKVLADM